MSFSEIKQWIVGIIAGLFSVLFLVLPLDGIQQATGRITKELPTTPDDFLPTVRLVIFTDTHNHNDRVADGIDTAYALFDNAEPYAGVDGFFCLGDFSSIGEEGAYANFVQTLKEHVRPETPVVSIHGNHEFKNDNYREYFIKHFGYDPDTVTEINGFSCIAFSGERGLTEWTFTTNSLKWLSSSIKEAEAKRTDGRAIFVFQHPHPWGTVYGSTVWGDPQLNPILTGHTAVVDFSGHSHFPMNDPRSINQSTFTAVGCGAMEYYELDNNCIPGQHPDGYDPADNICVVEADNDGSVRIRGYDLLSDTYFCDYYIDNVNDVSTYAYTYNNLMLHDKAPVFPADAAATAYQNDSGEWILSFTEAEAAEGYIVHEYNVSIFDEKGLLIYHENLINDYFVIDDSTTADFRIGSDTLESGKNYTLLVRAESAYHKLSKTIKLNFTAQ
ncbi:MAG: metallophosphoesterase [Clostridia bacterium]|jgi:hypothetical protein|nr:metallophosphoesterase [Clostridia bacterium]